jgi:hypothetical protein
MSEGSEAREEAEPEREREEAEEARAAKVGGSLVGGSLAGGSLGTLREERRRVLRSEWSMGRKGGGGGVLGGEEQVQGSGRGLGGGLKTAGADRFKLDE